MSARPKYETPPRFFTAYEKFGEPQPEDRLLYLELEHWDYRTKEARYRIVLATAGAEVWLGAVEGYASRAEVNVAAAAAPIDNPLQGDSFTLILDGTPKVVQLEIRRPREGTTTPYRLIITGATPQSVRYQTVRLVTEYAPFAYFRIGADGRPHLTADRDAADATLFVGPDGVPVVRQGQPGNRAVVLMPDATNAVIEREVS